jgi:MFS family permease
MHPRIILSVGNFFFSIFSALITFILLPYLSLFIPTAYIGFVVAASAVVALCVFPFLPKLVERYGAQYIALVLAFAEMIVLLALAGAPGAIASIALMILSIAIQPFLAYQFDILLEATIADNNTTGEVRALFRTAWSVAALAAPLLLGALLADSNEYGRIFIASTAMLIPIVVLFATKSLPKGPAPKLYEMYGTLVHIAKHRDLVATTFANLLLYLFYVWMPLYTPVYLHSVLGISWANLGWMFSIMLVPYVLIEYPAGWVADRYLGDKELMLAGFLIAGGMAMTLAFLTPATPLFIILIILVGSRIGSALVEAMVEAHFFRRVSKRDIDSVSVFRAVWPLSYIIGPVIGSVILVYGNYHLFFILTGGFVALAGIISTLLIKDFK